MSHMFAVLNFYFCVMIDRPPFYLWCDINRSINRIGNLYQKLVLSLRSEFKCSNLSLSHQTYPQKASPLSHCPKKQSTTGEETASKVKSVAAAGYIIPQVASAP